MLRTNGIASYVRGEPVEPQAVSGLLVQSRTPQKNGDALRSLTQEWNVERRPKVRGAVTGYLFELDRDSQDWIMIGIFEDKEAFMSNANDPEQDRWFWRVMEHLESEPQWNDGAVYET